MQSALEILFDGSNSMIFLVNTRLSLWTSVQGVCVCVCDALGPREADVLINAVL